MERYFDLVIVGAGPAGCTASLYASRAGLSTLLLDNGAPGGKLVKTYEIANYPGVGASSGVDLAMKMFEQATSFGAVYEYGDVIEITKDKVVKLFDGQEIQAKAVLIATGTKERLLNIPGEQENIGRGVSFCAVCDGAFFKDKDVVVIGGGNSALEESLYLTKFANVTIVIRRDVFRAEKNIQEQVESNDRIKIITKHIPKQILSENGKVCGIVLENVDTRETQTLSCSGIFPYIGQDPMTQSIQNLGICDDRGYVIVDKNMETSIKGIYAAGDVIQKDLRQVVTATNDGAIAAQHVFHELSK
ncbi:NAD(P)/FAD-dependent oxidoreductase [Floccifex porci]|uniref:FAD-binding protein n=1 Tax=Floccifex porci TaxID=2606629 RepID=A0A7X2N1X0_9FIRM|nr:FAD-dependent oxidoreductase [Floccifex porci]MSS00958.1 FAD-binding protein [Floccifex porci]